MALRRFTGSQNQRYVAIKYSVRGRDLGSTVEEAIDEGTTNKSSFPPGYRTWTGRANTRARNEPTSG